MGCFTFLSTVTVMLFSILLLFTTPILVLRKFLSTIVLAFSFFIISRNLHGPVTANFYSLPFNSFLSQGRFQPRYILSQGANAHRVFQRRNSVCEFQLLQTQFIFLDARFQIRYIQILQALYKINSL